MQLRVIKNLGTYRVDQRLRMDTFHARQLIELGIAVADDSLGAEAILTTKETLSDEDLKEIKRDWEEAHTGPRPTGVPKRRHRRREVADDE
jgi:hypothetical protein